MSKYPFLRKHGGCKVLVDIENAGITPGSMIFTIGATIFDLSRYDENDPMAPIIEKFYVHVDAESQKLPAIHVDRGTLKFWSEQSIEAKAEIHAMQEYRPRVQHSLRRALELLLGFIPDEAMVFARGPDFENGHLSKACSLVGLRWCRRYNRMDDVRTFVNGFTGGNTGYIELPDTYPKLIKHHALHDCIRDVLEMQLSIIKYHTE